MGKFTTYMLLTTGIVLLFYFGGLLTGTATSTVLTLLLHPESLQNWSGTTILFASISTAAIFAGIIAGIIVRNVELAIMSAIVPVFAAFGWDIIQVYLVLAAEIPVLAILFMSPVMFVYVMSIVEFWRGRD